MRNIPGTFLQCVAVAACLSVAVVASYLILATRSSLMSLIADPQPHPHPQNPLCSFDVFRSVARGRADGFVSGTGTWSRSADGTPERFQPDICRFRHGPSVPHRDVVNCIRQHRLQYIVFAGDSNALRYYFALQRLLSNLGAKCVVLRVRICTVLF